jgi:ABC-type antimicrobial peptide transport system permease subunit
LQCWSLSAFLVELPLKPGNRLTVKMDPLVLVGVVALLIVVAAVAGAGPARRASDIDPITALRFE